MLITIIALVIALAIFAVYKLFSFSSGIGNDALSKDLPDSWTVDTTTEKAEKVAKMENEKPVLSIVSSIE